MSKLRPLLGVPLLALVFAAGCLPDSTTAPIPTIEETTFAPALGIDLSTMTKTPDGVYYKDITVGTGATAAIGKNVGIYYDGFRTDGFKFDSLHVADGPTLDFQLGVNGIIVGLQLGMLGMNQGGVRQIIIPSQLGYGNVDIGGGLIPPNSILVFTVDLQKVN